MSVFKTDNVVKIYNDGIVLDNVSMCIEEGDVYGFVGENGAGKTTIIRLATGLIQPEEGTFSIFNVDYKDEKINEVRKQIGAVVETPSLYNHFSAKDNLLMQATLLNTKVDCDELLKMVGLDPQNKRRVGNYSLGMRQRVAIAMALVGSPKFLILDEPMNGLDPEGIIEIRNLIIKLNKENNITFLISSHILSELQLVANKYGFISHGKLVQEITAEELYAKATKTITLKVNNTDELLPYLGGFNYQIADKNTAIIIGDINPTGLLVALNDKGVEVLEITTNKGNIEDYYMQIIGGKKNA